MIDLRQYLENHQIGLDEVDSKVLANFLWEARAQIRAAHPYGLDEP